MSTKRSHVVTVDIFKPNYEILKVKAQEKRYSVKEYVNDVLASVIQKEKFLERYAPFLSVINFIDDRVTLHDGNPKSKYKYIDVKVRNSQLICEAEEKTDCIHCFYVWARPEVAKLNLKKPQ